MEHHPTGEEHGAERDADREQREPRELEPNGRQRAERQGDDEGGDEAPGCDHERGDDHGANR